MEGKNYCVYKHTSPSGKVYIGITSDEPTKRWGSNGINYRSQNFWNAIQKYGWDNIKHEILEKDLCEEKALELEKHYISKYKSNNPKYGYNHTPGGDIINLTNKKVGQYKDDTLINVFPSAAYINEYLGYKSKSTVSKWCTDNKKHFGYYWRYIDDDFEINIDDSFLDFNIYEDKNNSSIQNLKNADNNKPIYQIKDETIIKRWDSIKDAAESLNLKHGSISRVLTGKRKSTGGYIWRYAEN